jgi:hypothetical protein
MIGPEVEGIFKNITSDLSKACAGLGFRTSGSRMRMLDGQNCAVIELQKGKYRDADELEFTAKFGVICRKLIFEDNFDIKKSKIIDAQLRVDAGYFCKERSVNWWCIDGNTDSKELIIEVTDLVVNKGVPFLKKYLSESNLVDLWDSGISPGMTDRERVRYLSILKGD